MTLPVDIDSSAYKFYKNLNSDVKLKSDSYGRWDIDFNYNSGDWVVVDGFESVANACVIAIMTRFNELGFMSLYSDFGCRIHELIKENKTKSVEYRIELFVKEVLVSIRRIKSINWVEVHSIEDDSNYDYSVNFSIECLNDEDSNNLKAVNTFIGGFYI